MMIRGYELAGKTIAVIIGIALLALAIFIVPSCVAKMRAEKAQHKVDNAQSGAFQNSAADAVVTQAGVNQNETESEAITRSNERNIRDAPGASDKVNPAVRDAGFASLCKRASFRNSPTGRLRCPAPAKLEDRR